MGGEGRPYLTQQNLSVSLNCLQSADYLSIPQVPVVCRTFRNFLYSLQCTLYELNLKENIQVNCVVFSMYGTMRGQEKNPSVKGRQINNNASFRSIVEGI